MKKSKCKKSKGETKKMRFIAEEKHEQGTMVLSFFEDGDEVTVRGTDADGAEWDICTFSTEGALYLHGGIEEESGLELDEDGRIVVEDD